MKIISHGGPEKILYARREQVKCSFLHFEKYYQNKTVFHIVASVQQGRIIVTTLLQTWTLLSATRDIYAFPWQLLLPRSIFEIIRHRAHNAVTTTMLRMGRDFFANNVCALHQGLAGD